MDDLLKNNQVKVGMGVFAIGIIWLLVQGLTMDSIAADTVGLAMLALVVAMLGVFLVLLGLSIDSDAAGGMLKETTDVSAALQEMRDQLTEMMDTMTGTGDDEQSADTETLDHTNSRQAAFYQNTKNSAFLER